MLQILRRYGANIVAKSATKIHKMV